MADDPSHDATPKEPASDEAALRAGESWWSSAWGPGPLISLALPLMISAGFVSLTLFTDRTLLYWQSELSASAALGAGTIYWTLICFPTGLLGYVSTFVSQYRGAKQYDQIARIYRHASWLAWAIVPVLVAVMVFASLIFSGAGHKPELAKQETIYLQLLLVGGIGVLFYSVQSGLLTGQGRTGTVLAIDAVATVVNLALDAVLIFGFGPIPELGLVGAAIATSFSFWLKIPIAWAVLRRNQDFTSELAGAYARPVQSEMLRRFMRFGSPAGLQLLAEGACFSVILLQVGRLGELQTAATTLALGVNILVFVPMIGLGIGVGVLVGQRLTEGSVALARRAVTCGIAITVLYTSVFACGLLLAPDLAVSIYAWGTPDDRFEEVRPLLMPLLKIIALYCVLDGLQIVFVGAIKGAGDTLFVLLATVGISAIVLCTGMLVESALGNSLLLWWYMIAVWVASMGIVFALRYFSGAWTSKRVID
ncbi:MAG: MATE family efflux transporter [Aureliella sp.]